MSGSAKQAGTVLSTACRAWVLRRRDGLVLGFTDHDVDIAVEGVRCSASSGLAAGAVEVGTGLAVDNGDVSGALSGAGLTAKDVRAGRWDGASVTAYRVDWTAPDAATVTFRGSLGEIAEGGGAFTAELRGLSAALNVPQGRVFHRRCGAVLGDALCGVDLTAQGRWIEAAVVSVGEEGRVLEFAQDDLDGLDGSLMDGTCAWLDGAAVGLSSRIKDDRSEGKRRTVALWVPPRVGVSAGARVRLTVGCDKAMATCAASFGNVTNFRGFPHLPSDDWQVAAPRTGSGG